MVDLSSSFFVNVYNLQMVGSISPMNQWEHFNRRPQVQAVRQVQVPIGPPLVPKIPQGPHAPFHAWLRSFETDWAPPEPWAPEDPEDPEDPGPWFRRRIPHVFRGTRCKIHWGILMDRFWGYLILQGESQVFWGVFFFNPSTRVTSPIFIIDS